MKKAILLILLSVLSMRLYAQYDLSFIKNDGVKKEINFLLKFLDESPQTRVLKDSLVFLEMFYDSVPYHYYPDTFSMTFRTTLEKDLYEIKDDTIISHYHTESFYYKQLSENRILLLRDAKSILNKKLKKEKINNICDRMMDYEFFETDEYTTIEKEIFYNSDHFHYTILSDGSVTLDFVETHDIETFMWLRYGIGLKQRKLKNIRNPSSIKKKTSDEILIREADRLISIILYMVLVLHQVIYYMICILIEKTELTGRQWARILICHNH